MNEKLRYELPELEIIPLNQGDMIVTTSGNKTPFEPKAIQSPDFL